MDLEQQLDINLRHIQTHYACYVDCIRAIIEEKSISAEQLSSFLINLPASISTKKLRLLSNLKAELQKAEKITDIFILLTTKYASFLDYDIFEIILKRYGPNENREELINYPVHLKAYLEKHKIKEFIKLPQLINPKLQKLGDESKKINIKLSIKKTQNLSTLKEVMRAMATILGLRTSALRLLSIKKGCVFVTLLIPASIADVIFTSETVFTPEQEHEFQTASVLWFECNGYKFDFREESETNTSRDSPSGNSVVVVGLLSSPECIN